MSKTLITVLGLVVSLGVIALGFFLVALPLYIQSVGVGIQTATVANTNVIYAAEVDSLAEQEANLDQINASVSSLQTQIPATGQLDDVFEVIGRAASASEIVLTSVTAGDQVEFVERVGVEDGANPEATPTVEPTPTAAPAPGTETGDPADPVDTVAPSIATPGRQQVEFVIVATAADMGRVTAFLDALRAGPRLLENITVTVSTSSEGAIDIQVAALTFVDSEE